TVRGEVDSLAGLVAGNNRCHVRSPSADQVRANSRSTDPDGPPAFIDSASSAPHWRARSSSPSLSGPYVPVTTNRPGFASGRYPAPWSPRSISPVAPRGDHQTRVSNDAKRPRPHGRFLSHERIEGCA